MLILFLVWLNEVKHGVQVPSELDFTVVCDRIYSCILIYGRRQVIHYFWPLYIYRDQVVVSEQKKIKREREYRERKRERRKRNMGLFEVDYATLCKGMSQDDC
ncbi:hypothetical protein ACOSP7_000801 [Xanthoceras sorbifolium]